MEESPKTEITTPTTTAPIASAPVSDKARHWTIVLTLGLGAVIVLGLVAAFFGNTSPTGFGWYLFSYAMGLTMIVLPCTFPLAFVIVPLSLGNGPVKGLGMAL